MPPGSSAPAGRASSCPGDAPGLCRQELNARGISLVFAELKHPVRRKIERYGLTRTIDPHHFFPTIESAITAFRDQTGAQWTTDGQVSQPELPGAPLHERGVPPGNGPA